MKPRPVFEIFQGLDYKWYFRLEAPNGKIIAQSEGYNDKRGANRGIASVKKNAGKARIVTYNEAH